MSNSNTKVRFAPSPTGLLHLGGMRSALFNWLYARKTGGSFMLRLEDTDRERFVPEAIDQIKASHQWLGLVPDETAVQSERLEVYRQHANQLLKTGALYSCWCSSERLTQLRDQSNAEKRAFKYDRHCLTHPGNPSDPHVLRFKIPAEPAIVSWQDAVRGESAFKTVDLDDFVALKSDGYPTYNFANVVDDHEMQITHVLRAEEFLSSTPKHLLLYAAFDWQAPTFAHLPQVLGPDGRSKLSKRLGAKSVLEYRDEGYLPEAVINFMALLGWNAGEGSTKEIYTREELVATFSLERIQKSPAVFDPERLDWMNGLYIRSLSLDTLAEAAAPFWPQSAKDHKPDYLKAALSLVQERLKKLSELPQLTGFFFTEPQITPDLFNFKQLTAKQAEAYLEAALKLLESDQSLFASPESLEKAFRGLVDDDKPANLYMALRIAVTGQTATPPLFETMVALGRDKVMIRLENTLRSLSKT